MTITKEYEAMMEGAADAYPTPWKLTKSSCGNYFLIKCKNGYPIPSTSFEKLDIQFKTMERIAFLSNLAPELIRVIELAEEALQYCADWHQGGDVVTEALSEIRKIRVE